MATFDYIASAATASRLLAKFGQVVTLSRGTPGVYDPVTGDTTGGGVESQTASAVLLPYKLGDAFADGALVNVGDRKCLIEAAGLDWEPDALTTLTDAGGEAWQLERVETLAPAGTAVLHTANATR